MTDHYYSESPHSELHKKTWNFELNKNRYTFTSGTGVFSKDKIDFGTELLLQTFHPPPIQGNYLDLGCGYGPIGIVLASQERNRHVVMVDINERAIGFSKENIKLNKIENATVIKSDGLSNLQDKTFAAIITNPPIRVGKKVIYHFFSESKKRLEPSGELWIVIQKKQGALSAKKYLSTIFDYVEVVARKKGYFIIRSK